MISHQSLSSKALIRLIKVYAITLAGNRKLKIYGRLTCRCGKRMKKGKRVFFKDVPEAIRHGYRPCGCCLKTQYEQWKVGKNRVEQQRRKVQI